MIIAVTTKSPETARSSGETVSGSFNDTNGSGGSNGFSFSNSSNSAGGTFNRIGGARGSDTIGQGFASGVTENGGNGNSSSSSSFFSTISARFTATTGPASSDTEFKETNASGSFSESGTFGESETISFISGTSTGTDTNAFIRSSTTSTLSFSIPTVIGGITSTTTSSYEQTTNTFVSSPLTFQDAAIETIDLLPGEPFEFCNTTYFLDKSEIAWILTASSNLEVKFLSEIAYSTNGSFTLSDTKVISNLVIPTTAADALQLTTDNIVLSGSQVSAEFTNTDFYFTTQTITTFGKDQNSTNSDSTSNSTNSNSSIPDHIPNSSGTTTTNGSTFSTFQDTLFLISDFVTTDTDSPLLAISFSQSTEVDVLLLPTTAYTLTYGSDGNPIGFATTSVQTTATTSFLINVPNNLFVFTQSDTNGGLTSNGLGITTTVSVPFYGLSQKPTNQLILLTPAKSNGVCLPDGKISDRDPVQQVTFPGVTFPNQFVVGAQTNVFCPLPHPGLTTAVDSGNTYKISWSNLSISVTKEFTEGNSTSTITTTFSGILGTDHPIQNPNFLSIGADINGSSFAAGGGQVNHLDALLLISAPQALEIIKIDGSQNAPQTSKQTQDTTYRFSFSDLTGSAFLPVELFDVMLGTIAPDRFLINP